MGKVYAYLYHRRHTEDIGKRRESQDWKFRCMHRLVWTRTVHRMTTKIEGTRISPLCGSINHKSKNNKGVHYLALDMEKYRHNKNNSGKNTSRNVVVIPGGRYTSPDSPTKERLKLNSPVQSAWRVSLPQVCNLLHTRL